MSWTVNSDIPATKQVTWPRSRQVGDKPVWGMEVPGLSKANAGMRMDDNLVPRLCIPEAQGRQAEGRMPGSSVSTKSMANMLPCC